MLTIEHKTIKTVKLLLRYSIELLLSVVLFACSSDKSNNSINDNPSSYFTEKESQELLIQIIPYSAKLPKGYNFSQRFNTALDSFYLQEIKKYQLERYFYTEKDSTHYFLITREAPSLYEKRIAIVGKFQKDENGHILNYEEGFWTFKMKIPELTEKSEILFREYVSGNDLSKYHPGNSTEEWIEFPDAHSKFDKKEQRWIFTAE
jgi:hypothetical protein